MPPNSTATRLLLVSLVSLASLAASVAHADDLVIANGWISAPILDEDSPLYFVVQNKGSEIRTITGVAGACCVKGSIERAVVRDGRMASETMAEMQIPAGGAVAFAPRGLFVSLRREPGTKFLEDDRISLTLELASGERVPFEAVVKDE